MYTLKPPLKVNCLQCQKKMVVNFCPPRQSYSNKNHWGYWTGQKEKQGQYICDTCLIDMYRNHKQTYLNSITESKKRRTFRDYFGSKDRLLTRTEWKELESNEVHDALLKLVQENSRQAKKIQELEKKLTKKQKKS